jgi:hypothetical protein
LPNRILRAGVSTDKVQSAFHSNPGPPMRFLKRSRHTKVSEE